MSRLSIPTREAAPAASQPLLDAVGKSLGVVPNLFRLVGQSPAALEGVAEAACSNSAAMLVLYGLRLGADRYYEAALLIAMLGFITTVVLSKFLTRGDVIE